jgi:hypothetical protein
VNKTKKQLIRKELRNRNMANYGFELATMFGVKPPPSNKPSRGQELAQFVPRRMRHEFAPEVSKYIPRKSTPRATATTPYRSIRTLKKKLETNRAPVGRYNIFRKHPLNSNIPIAYKRNDWNSYYIPHALEPREKGPVFFNKNTKEPFHLTKKGQRIPAVNLRRGRGVRPRKPTNTWPEYLRRLEKHKAYIRGEPERRKLMGVINNALRLNTVKINNQRNRNRWLRTGMIVLNENGNPRITNKAITFYDAKRATF